MPGFAVLGRMRRRRITHASAFCQLIALIVDQALLTEAGTAGGPLARARSRARAGHRCAAGRKIRGARFADQRVRLPVRGRILRDGLIRLIELILEIVQTRVDVDGSPASAIRLIGGLRDFPAFRRFFSL